MKLKPIVVLALILLALLRIELPCGCAESQNSAASIAVVSIENTDFDLCADCGHKKSCCAHKKFANDSNLLTASTFTISELPLAHVAVVCEAVLVASRAEKNHFWNKAPPFRSLDSLYSLGQKLSV